MRRGTLVNDKLPIASGAVTQANMKLSAAAGVAFFDMGINTIKIGSLIKIRDSAGRAIQGFVKEAGTGETLGSEISTGTLAVRSLYKVTSTITNSFYGLAVDGYFTSAGTETATLTEKVKQVLTPSATGFTISSTKGGTAMDNWSQKDAAFNYNSATFTYEVYRVLNAPAVLTSSVTAGNALVDATDANAFIAPVGVDLTPYQDGRHIAHLTDSSGNVAFGWISATAPSGLDESAEYHKDTGFAGAIGTDWTATEWSISSGKAVANTSGAYSIYQINTQMNTSLVVNALYKTSFDITNFTFGELANRFVSQLTGILRTATGTGFIDYFTASVSAIGSGVLATISTVASIDNKSLKRLNMPASTGALILNRQAGSRGFTYKSASWDANKAQTLKILFVGE